MTYPRGVRSWLWLGSAAVLAGFMFLPGCMVTNNNSGGNTTPGKQVVNTVSLIVNSGPANNAVNAAYVSVLVCAPGSTTNCFTIPDIQVDTGTTGLRILATAPGISGLLSNLTPVTVNNSAVAECFQFSDGSYLWGPVAQADVSMAGEVAASLPIQIIDSGTAPANVPSSCSNGGQNRGTTTLLQANGILGIGPAQQDCGSACAISLLQTISIYWLCPGGVCSSEAPVPITSQVSNPVAFFKNDKNGVMLTMDSVGSSGAATVSGTLTFGIGTQSDNALGKAQVYSFGIVPSGNLASSNTIQTTYNNGTYPGYLDTASPVTYLLDPGTIGVAACSGTYRTIKGLYCPGSNTTLTVSNAGSGGTPVTTQISIGNAQGLLSNAGLNAYSNLAGISGTGAINDFVEFGMPFFYGKTVYVGIAGMTPPSGVSAPYGFYAF